MKLSNRLKEIAAMVDKNIAVADIGTDHGFIPISLVEDGIIKKALAMDVRIEPLLRAREHIKEHGLEANIETRLSYGLDELREGEADTVIIAGMGGRLIIDILERGKGLVPSIDNFILSPHTGWEELRIYLRTNGFEITDEAMVYEDDKYYLILKAKFKGASNTKEAKKIYDMFGACLIKKKDKLLCEYLKKEKNKYMNIREYLSSNSTGNDERIKEIDSYLDAIKETEYVMQQNI